MTTPDARRRKASWWGMLDTLERRVTLGVTLLLVVVIGGMFWLSHSRVVDAVSGAEMTRLQASSDQLAQTIQSQARRLISDAARAATASPLPEALRSPRSPAAITAAAKVLAAMRANSPQVHDIALVDREGRVVVAAGTPDAELVRPTPAATLETVTAPTVSPLAVHGDTVVYAVSAPVTDIAGKQIGFLVITRQLTGGTESATLFGGLVGRGARVLLGNADGGLMTDLARPIAVARRPEPGRAAAYRAADGNDVLGASSFVRETPWVVVVEGPRAGALRAASDFTRDSAMAGLICVMVGALLSWLLIRRTMRPLGEVTRAARDITAGNLSRRASVGGRSEVALLGEAFNQMVDRVGRSAQDLASRATQLEASNKELNESEAKYRGLFEHLPDAILVHRDNEILFANPAAWRLLGVTSERELANRPVLDFVVSADRETVLARIEKMRGTTEPAPTIELRLQGADRRVVTVEATSMPMQIDGVPAVQTILHDVSERRQLEEQFRQSQKMDAVGRLAGGVAHDFNNLLTVIQAHAEFAMGADESEEDRRRDIEEIRKTAENAARLTRQLLTFSRKQSVTPAQIDLNDAIAGMLGMIKRLIGDDIEVVIVAGGDISGIWADPGQIQQVLLNLAVNARDAMPNGGVLRFETANITVGEGYVGAASAAIPPGEYVMLAVQDTGVGMTEEVRSRVFEPFFTTKQAGRGTGLGLSTVYGIVKQWGGHIWVYSEPGMGAAFKVFFPPQQMTALEITGTHAIPGLAATGHGRLLVVEDDRSVRDAVVRALRRGGFTVTEAREANEALAVLKGSAPIDLLITDMMMPGMPGIALLAEARSHRPGLPAIVLSGYSEQPSKEYWRVPDHAVFVEKPISPAELIRRVNQLLPANP